MNHREGEIRPGAPDTINVINTNCRPTLYKKCHTPGQGYTWMNP